MSSDPRSNEWTHPEGNEDAIQNEPCAHCGLHFGPEHYTDNRGADNVCDACKRHIREREKCPECDLYVTGGEVCEGCLAYREHLR